MWCGQVFKVCMRFLFLEGHGVDEVLGSVWTWFGRGFMVCIRL